MNRRLRKKIELVKCPCGESYRMFKLKKLDEKKFFSFWLKDCPKCGAEIPPF